jgi:hypothetical protein
VQEFFEGEGTANPIAVCIAKRRGRTPVTVRFSVEDAKRAGLWGKQGPWTQYPKRMMAMRARGFALRDAFADVLKGLITAEEAQDYPTEQAPRDITPAKPANPLDAIAAPVVEPEVDAIEMAQANAAAQMAAVEDAEDIQVFYLPSYSPEPNPDEMANADIKQAVTTLAPARTKLQLVKATARHLRSVQRQPAPIKKYFKHGPVRYAA